jgi:HSP20 family protein
MALLPVRRGGSLTRPGSQPVTGWDPFTELEDLYQRMGQLMTGAFEGMWQPLARAWAPLAGLSETDDAYIAEVELPGVHRDDISVELAGQELVITGEYKDTGEGRMLRRGRRAGRFEHRVLLPGQADPDKITATLADGVLTVTVPKAETGKPRRIEITAG